MSITSRLNDRIDIHGRYPNNPNTAGELIRADVPAYVFGQSSLGQPIEGDPLQVMTTVRVILPPDFDIDLDPQDHMVVWRGQAYRIDGRPVWSRRNGRDHHQTIELQRRE